MTTQIFQRLSSISEIKFIDEDLGQLDFTGEDYPITFPACLIDMPQGDYSDLHDNLQSCRVQLTVKLVIESYNDTHYSSGTADSIEKRAELNRKVVEALQGFNPMPGRTINNMVRISSRNYAIEGVVKVYETTFAYEFMDEFRQLDSQPHL